VSLVWVVVWAGRIRLRSSPWRLERKAQEGDSLLKFVGEQILVVDSIEEVSGHGGDLFFCNRTSWSGAMWTYTYQL
jgi:hypothetical protein